MEEDIIVSFLTGLDGQFQTGSVTVNIYVPDKDNGSKVLVKDVGRCRYLARKADEVVRSLKPTDYRFSFINAEIFSYAASSSSPSNLSTTSMPPLIPSPIIVNIFLQSPDFPSFEIVTLLVNSFASFTSSPAGRACIPCGSVNKFFHNINAPFI